MVLALSAALFSGCGNAGASGGTSAGEQAAGATAADEAAGGSGGEGAQAEETAAGGDELDSILAAGKLVVGVEGTYPPFTYHDESGALTGFDVEVATKIAEKLGVEAEFVEAAWDSLLIGIDSGRLDTVANAVSVTEERAEKYDFSDPYYFEARRVIVRAEDDSIQTEDDLDGKKVATNVTNAFIPWYESKGAEIVGIDTSGEAIELVLSGRADLCGTSVPVLNSYMEEHPDAEGRLKVAFVIPDSEDRIAIPVRKGEARLLEAVNQALAELREEGTLQELSEKYLQGDYTSSAYENEGN